MRGSLTRSICDDGSAAAIGDDAIHQVGLAWMDDDPVAVWRAKKMARFRMPVPLWRTKKSHFRPSDEESVKNVDKDAVNTTIGFICYFRCMNILLECTFYEFSCI